MTMPDQHAILSASAAHRWLHCTPSVRATEHLPDTTSQAALEGTAAHALAEYKLYQRYYPTNDQPRPVSAWDSPQLEQHTDDYVSYIAEQVETLTQLEDTTPKIRIEQRVDYSDIAEAGFGTADFIAYTPNALHIIDLKYGQGVKVDAPGNPQLRLYAYGAAKLANLPDSGRVQMSIFQPRLGHISTATTTMRELKTWAVGTVRPRAVQAWEGAGEYAAGDWCRFCKLKATCRARRDQNLELAKYDFAAPAEISHEEIAEILQAAPGFKTWLKDVEDYALTQATRGTRFPGFKRVAGRGRRQVLDEDRLAEALEQAGINPWDRRLLPITQLEKRAGKKLFNTLTQGLVEKTTGRPLLAPVDDPRPELPPDDPGQDFTKI